MLKCLSKPRHFIDYFNSVLTSLLNHWCFLYSTLRFLLRRYCWRFLSGETLPSKVYRKEKKTRCSLKAYTDDEGSFYSSISKPSVAWNLLTFTVLDQLKYLSLESLVFFKCENRFLPSQINGRTRNNSINFFWEKAFLGALAGCRKVGIYYSCWLSLRQWLTTTKLAPT